MNLVTTHHRFISKHHVHNFFGPTSTITTPPVKSLEISDNATINVQSGSSTSCIGGALSNSCSIEFRLDYHPWHTCTHMNPNPAELVSMFAGTNINNCVFQLSQNPVHGMPSSITVITDNDHQAPKLKRRRAFILDSDDKE